MKPEIDAGTNEMDDRADNVRSPVDLFTDTGFLIMEARMPDFTAKGRTEGPHCPQQAGRGVITHKCTNTEPQCSRAAWYRDQMEIYWKNGIPMCIEVLLYPDCEHGKRACADEASHAGHVSQSQTPVLMELWTVKLAHRKPTDRELPLWTLMSALRSYLYFSQISAWLNLSHGHQPRWIGYRLSAPGEDNGMKFRQRPVLHEFPAVAVLRTEDLHVMVESLPRSNDIITVPCQMASCSAALSLADGVNVKSSSRAYSDGADSSSSSANGCQKRETENGAKSELSPRQRSVDMNPRRVFNAGVNTQPLGVDYATSVFALQNSTSVQRARSRNLGASDRYTGAKATVSHYCDRDQPSTSSRDQPSSSSRDQPSTSSRDQPSTSSYGAKYDSKKPQCFYERLNYSCDAKLYDYRNVGGPSTITVATCRNAAKNAASSATATNPADAYTRMSYAAAPDKCQTPLAFCHTDSTIHDQLRLLRGLGALTEAEMRQESSLWNLESPKPITVPSQPVQYTNDAFLLPRTPRKDMQLPLSVFVEQTDEQNKTLRSPMVLMTESIADQTYFVDEAKDTPINRYLVSLQSMHMDSDSSSPSSQESLTPRAMSPNFTLPSCGPPVTLPERVARSSQVKRCLSTSYEKQQRLTSLQQPPTKRVSCCATNATSGGLYQSFYNGAHVRHDVTANNDTYRAEVTTARDVTADLNDDKDCDVVDMSPVVDAQVTSSQFKGLKDQSIQLCDSSADGVSINDKTPSCVGAAMGLDRPKFYLSDDEEVNDDQKSSPRKNAHKNYRRPSSKLQRSPRKDTPRRSASSAADDKITDQIANNQSVSGLLSTKRESVPDVFQKSKPLLKSCLIKKELESSQSHPAFQSPPAVPTNEEQVSFRKRLVASASMIFSSKSGLPRQSSPAPMKRNASSFEFDHTLCSPRAIKNAISCTRLDTSEENGSPNSDPYLRKISVSAPPTTTNSLLGNFEESLLNGRIDPVGVVEGFSADIGASGTFCPPHLHLPVTAYFFKLSDDNAPSPYLGHISMESKKGYHVPTKGNVQVTLFNPNKTVVKVFVVMYNLGDMPPNSTTFLRQRTLYLPNNFRSQCCEALPSYLRYLIHLRFRSSKSGRIYLHTDIRLIFARDKFEFDARVSSYELRSFTEGPVNPKFSPVR